MRKQHYWLLSEFLYYGGLIALLGGPAVLIWSRVTTSFAAIFFPLALLSLFAGGLIKLVLARQGMR